MTGRQHKPLPESCWLTPSMIHARIHAARGQSPLCSLESRTLTPSAPLVSPTPLPWFPAPQWGKPPVTDETHVPRVDTPITRLAQGSPMLQRLVSSRKD
ncbi:hypothetical protein DPEC_G00032730 [Dallia pectoralis]|uniref:Uncharacterized protein n=1 Tax=Dallia pectoralis TaxID=75939 RepID=A0ACC2HCQ1_DALPE|nr:hypothetical protein DPEC_G00032730 [Dallia pectoralis]